MMGKYAVPDDKGIVEVVAGEYKGTKGPALTFTPMHVYNAKLKKGASIELNFPSTYNTGILMIEGNADLNGETAPPDHFVLFKNDGETISVEAIEDSILLILSGDPINEPIAQYGPFLMNTREELEQAIDDVNAGKFGMLEE